MQDDSAQTDFLLGNGAKKVARLGSGKGVGFRGLGFRV